MIFQSIIRGFLGSVALFAAYFGIVGFISGLPFAISQFFQFWYFIVALVFGFGVQIGLYSYLKNAIRHNAPKGVVAVSGTTSAVAMVSCCSHYLANLIPVISISGAVALVGQYQIELFWVGLVANAASIIYIVNRVIKFSKQ